MEWVFWSKDFCLTPHHKILGHFWSFRCLALYHTSAYYRFAPCDHHAVCHVVPDFLWLVLHIFESCSLITFWILFSSHSEFRSCPLCHSTKTLFTLSQSCIFSERPRSTDQLFCHQTRGKGKKQDQKKRKKITFHTSTKSKPHKHAPRSFMFIFAHCRIQFSSSSYINPHICHLVQEVLMPLFIHLNLVLFIISKSVISSRKFLRLFLHSLNVVLFIISKSVILSKKFLRLFLHSLNLVLFIIRY